jgi:RNA polymerase sigma-70 factor (ECF subfamily)
MKGVRVTDLDGWLREAYPAAFRTACLLLRDPVDAQDAVQEAFLRVWRFRDAVPAGDGRRAWLYRVVTNTCLSKLRSDAGRKRNVLADGEPLLEYVQAPAGDPHRAAELSELATDVLAALAVLPESLRVPVVLRWYAGLSEQEVAVAIKRRPGTVKSRLHQAKQLLAADSRLAAWAQTEKSDDRTEEVAR